MSENTYNFSIIIPVRKPDEGRLLDLLYNIDNQIGVRSEVFNYEVIVADDNSDINLGSNKYTGSVFNYKNLSLNKRKGEGYLIKKSIEKSSGDYLIFLNENCLLENNRSLLKIYKDVVKKKLNFSYLSKDYFSFIVKRDQISNFYIKDKIDYSYLSIQKELYDKGINSGNLTETIIHYFKCNENNLCNAPVDEIDEDIFKETKSILENSDEFLGKYEWQI